MARLPALAALLAIALVQAPALADKAPDAAQIRQAAEQFDAGAAAYTQGEFAEAASHFEAADAIVQSPQALRQAIRARQAAGQTARAATLAAQALERYPDDETTKTLARETLDKVAATLFKLTISCASPCVLAEGTRTIPGEANARWTVYLVPGKTSLSASFVGDAGAARHEVNATAGGSGELRLEPEAQRAPSHNPPETNPTTQDKTAKPPVNKAEETIAPNPPTAAPSSGLPKAVFFVGLAATAGALGATIWSGLDTLDSPGVDAVRAACAGKDETCPLYQEGRSKQTRTNILIGATAGTAAITAAIGIFFTNWRGAPKPQTGRTLLPTLAIGDGKTIVGAQGAF